MSRPGRCIPLLFALVCACTAAAALQKGRKPAPPPLARPFALADVEGKRHALADYRGKPVALQFWCGCQWCHDMAKLWGQAQRSGALQVGGQIPPTLVVFAGSADELKGFATETGLDPATTVLMPDPDLAVAQPYHAVPCPRVFVLDSGGRIRYTNNRADDAARKGPAALITGRAADALQGLKPLAAKGKKG